MSKKIISIILTIMLLASTAVMAVVNVSAAEGEYVFKTPKEYVPSAAVADIGTYRYYFMLPDDWMNEYTKDSSNDAPGIYWWDGTDYCLAVDGEDGTPWPGYLLKKYPDTKANVWYLDVPVDVTTIIFNNGLDGGPDKESPRYLKAVQTTDIGTEYYDAGESENYPDGTENFNNMIYVVDPAKTSENFDGKLTYIGEWYYYHGDGQWDTQLNPEFGGANGAAPHPSEGQTEPPTAAPQPQAPTTAPSPQPGATSNVSTKDQAATTAPTTLAGNGTIATGTISIAVIVLVIAAAAAFVVISIRKKEMEK